MTTQTFGVNLIWLFPRDGIVRNVYISNTGKTAAWTNASHIKETPKKSTTTA
ncbi:MAG: hypothetical protein IPM21_18085 [Acidobacteria bacterium]|nr:hypothetical protein [Acidobacteriota bacterium]